MRSVINKCYIRHVFLNTLKWLTEVNWSNTLPSQQHQEVLPKAFSPSLSQEAQAATIKYTGLFHDRALIVSHCRDIHWERWDYGRGSLVTLREPILGTFGDMRATSFIKCLKLIRWFNWRNILTPFSKVDVRSNLTNWCLVYCLLAERMPGIWKCGLFAQKS